MRLVVEPRIFDCFPGLHLPVALARDLRNAPSEALRSEWHEAWQEAGARDLPNAQTHPYVNAWREHLRGAGVSGKKFPTSIEAMLRRALKGGEPFHINPLVDFYNTLSLRHVVPAGAWDLDEVPADLQLRFTRAGDHFTSLDETQAVAVAEGEIAYASGPVVLTRHLMWRQARQALVQPETRQRIPDFGNPGHRGPERGGGDATGHGRRPAPALRRGGEERHSRLRKPGARSRLISAALEAPGALLGDDPVEALVLRAAGNAPDALACEGHSHRQSTG